MSEYITDMIFGTDSINSGQGGMFIAKYDSLFNIIWVKYIEGAANKLYFAMNNDEGIICTGDFFSSEIIFGSFTLPNAYPNYDYITDIFLAKLSSTVNDVMEYQPEGQVKVYPSPTSGRVTISGLPAKGGLCILNCAGQVLSHTELYGQESMSLSLPASGLYFVQVVSRNKVFAKKVVVISK